MRSTTAAQSSPARHTLHDALNAALDAALDLTVVGSFSRIGYAARRARFGWDRVAPQDLSGRVVVVTGATSGLGLAAARMVARRGADVFLVARDAARADAARRSIVADVPNAQIETIIADLADLDAVRAAATRIGAATERIDALINNAGALVHQLERTRDGIELTAQVHVVAPFLLTTMLLPRLHAAGTARVVTVSSGGMYLRPLDVDALDAPPMPFDGARAYAKREAGRGRVERAVVATRGGPRHPLSRDAPRLGGHAGNPFGTAPLPSAPAPAAAFGRRRRRHDGLVGRRT